MRNTFGRPCRRGKHALLALCLAGLAGLVVSVGAAEAAPASNSQAVAVTSNQIDLGGFDLAPIVLPLPIPVVLTDGVVTAGATWSGDLTTNVGWDTNKVRQGQNLDVSRVAPSPTGKIDVNWQLSGKLDGVSFGPVDLSKDNITCDPMLSGGGFECNGSSAEIPIASGPSLIPFPGPPFAVAMLGIGVTFDVTPNGAVVTRGFSIGGNPVAGPDNLSLTDSQQSETLAVPCSAKAGDPVDYQLDPYEWKPDTTATQQGRIRIILAYDPLGASEVGEITSIDAGPAEVSNPVFDLTGSGFTTAMGPLLPNDVNPSIDSLGPYAGDEGSPIQFSASGLVNSQCPISSYVWQFSDGTTSYGPNPQRAFGDGDKTYDGQLTVTDITGLSATRDFTVDVSNLPPSVNAGPDTTVDWGRPVQFNGQATDPGWVDQPTLQYTWTFGDGTPSAGGGPSVLHAYGMPSPTPGDYLATLTVCDKDGGCNDDSRLITVTKRDTTLGYTGPLSSNPSKTITLTANLVDEYGQAVSGRKVLFTLGAQSATGTTDSTGTASVNLRLNQKPGSYPLNASFAADAKYIGSSDGPVNFVIGK